jgi:uncharacterized membrane protein YGL010W
MRTLNEWLDAYGESHQNPTNKLIHWICVPVIFWCVLGLMASIPLGDVRVLFPEIMQPYVHLGTVTVLLGLIFYARLSIPMFIAFVLWCAFCLYTINLVAIGPWPLWMVSLGLFVLAWIGQFYGHKVEGAKPSFLEDLQFLMIGPAWLMAFILRGVGLMK